jgi:hypothetical protein
MKNILPLLGVMSLFICVWSAMFAIWTSKIIYIKITLTALIIFGVCVFIQKFKDWKDAI